MSVSIYLVAVVLPLAVGIGWLACRYGLPYLEVWKFKRSPFYKKMMEIQNNYFQNKLKPNPKSKYAKGDVFYISEPISSAEYEEWRAKCRIENYDENAEEDEDEDDLCENTLIKHIKECPDDFKEYIETIESNFNFLKKLWKAYQNYIRHIKFLKNF